MTTGMICVSISFILSLAAWFFIPRERVILFFLNHANEYLVRAAPREENSSPFLDPKTFKWTEKFRKYHKEILNEYYDYVNRRPVIPEYRSLNETLAAHTFGWRSLFLRVFNHDTDAMENFSLTKTLLDGLEKQGVTCTTAYLSLLDPITFIPPHVGVLKGVLRYHLGLIVPEDKDDCFIVVDGHKKNWSVGDDMMFDDTFLHHVTNRTGQKRLVLFLDIKRKFPHNDLANMINDTIIWFVGQSEVSQSLVDGANKVHHRSILQ